MVHFEELVVYSGGLYDAIDDPLPGFTFRVATSSISTASETPATDIWCSRRLYTSYLVVDALMDRVARGVERSLTVYLGVNVL